MRVFSYGDGIGIVARVVGTQSKETGIRLTKSIAATALMVGGSHRVKGDRPWLCVARTFPSPPLAAPLYSPPLYSVIPRLDELKSKESVHFHLEDRVKFFLSSEHSSAWIQLAAAQFLSSS